MISEPTPPQLRAAAKAAWKLDAFLTRCMDAGVMPLMVGFDLDFLAAQFWRAATEIEEIEEESA